MTQRRGTGKDFASAVKQLVLPALIHLILRLPTEHSEQSFNDLSVAPTGNAFHVSFNSMRLGFWHWLVHLMRELSQVSVG
jgi:hypothetical protein